MMTRNTIGEEEKWDRLEDAPTRSQPCRKRARERAVTQRNNTMCCRPRAALGWELEGNIALSISNDKASLEGARENAASLAWLGLSCQAKLSSYFACGQCAGE